MTATSEEQEPWEHFSLVDHFFFKPGAEGEGSSLG